ncbi:hypothetical protein IWW35_003357 [Coemansia sp. RSA 1878]|nr:hypothetical protein IWW35_003357 [Coemansia sp. RSA 1878]
MVRQAPPSRGMSSDGAQIARWFSALPVCTRFLIEATGVLTLVCGLHLLPGHYMALYWQSVMRQFQLWRIVTNFLVTGLTIGGVIHMVLLYRHSLALEKEEYGGRTADYAWFIMFCMILMTCLSWFTSTPVLSDGLLLSLVTLWSLHRADQIVNFFLGIQFPARYLPYAMMTMDFLFIGGFPYAAFYGWMSAQAYYYLSVDLPSQGGLNYIPTPQLVYRVFGQVRRNDPHAPNARMASTNNPIPQRPGGGNFWGQGRRLG